MALGIASAANFRDRIRTIVDREDTAYFSNDQLDDYIEMAVDEFLQQYYTIFEASQDARDKLEKMVRTETVSFASPFTVAVSTLNSTSTDPNYYRLLSARLTNSPTTAVKIIQIADY